MEKAKEKKKGPFLITFLIIILSSSLGVLVYEKYQGNQLAHKKIINHNLIKENSEYNVDITKPGLYADTYETGLNEDLPFSSKYYFKGKKVNNYLIWDNNCFQIINIAQNNCLKIMYIGSSNEGTCKNIKDGVLTIEWDEEGNNIWEQSSIKAYLENWVKELKLNQSPYFVKKATWYPGAIQFFSGGSLTIDIKNEQSEDSLYKGIVALINTSDYMKGAQKLHMIGAFGDDGFYKKDNYLHNSDKLWTLNKTLRDDKQVWAVENGRLESRFTTNKEFHAYPVVYLKENLILEGKGTPEIPYSIVENDQ